MLTSVLLMFYCIVLYIFLRKKKRKFGSTPCLSGAVPVLGNINLIPKDCTHAWKIVEAVSKESLEKRNNVLITFGPMFFMVLTDPDDSATLLNSLATEKHYTYNFAKPWIGNGLVTAPTSLWQAHRKMINPMFKQQVINGFIGVFNRQATRLIKSFQHEVGKGDFDHRRYLVLNGLETVCQTALGIDLGDETISMNKEYIEAAEWLMEGFIKRFHAIWLHNELIYDWSTLKRSLEKYIKIVHAMTDKAIEYRRKKLHNSDNDTTEPDGPQPFIDYMLRAADEKGVSDIGIREQLDTIVVAGHDTSANQLIFALMLLGAYGDVQERAYTEIQEVFDNSDREVDKYDLLKLEYLDAVLKECSRLYPVIPLVARSNTTEIKLKNCVIPPGTHCIVSVYGINRHQVWGPDADEFRPERWLDPSSLPTNLNAYSSFGLGKRACIGKTFAMTSMKITLVHILRKYRISSDISRLVLKMDAALRPASGHNIALELR